MPRHHLVAFPRPRCAEDRVPWFGRWKCACVLDAQLGQGDALYVLFDTSYRDQGRVYGGSTCSRTAEIRMVNGIKTIGGKQFEYELAAEDIDGGTAWRACYEVS